MNRLFGPKKTIEDECKEAKREVRSGVRSMEREAKALDRQEAEMTKEMKAAAKRGDTATARVIAGNIVKLQKQRQRMQGGKAQMRGIEYRASAMVAQQKQVETMGNMAHLMGRVNAQTRPEDVQKIMQQFQMENQKMDMAAGLMDDAFDGLDADMDLDDEAAGVMDQILDEVCLEVKQGARAHDAPLPQRAPPQATTSRSAAQEKL